MNIIDVSRVASVCWKPTRHVNSIFVIRKSLMLNYWLSSSKCQVFRMTFKRSGQKRELRLSQRSGCITRKLLSSIAFILCCCYAVFSAAVTVSVEPSTSDSRASSCQYLIGFLPVLSLNRGHSKHFVGAIDYALRRANEQLFREGSLVLLSPDAVRWRGIAIATWLSVSHVDVLCPNDWIDHNAICTRL